MGAIATSASCRFAEIFRFSLKNWQVLSVAGSLSPAGNNVFPGDGRAELA
jgi:hypothetical protein